jgi:hypothetical protein
MSDKPDDRFVVVTIADNGRVHAYAGGPVTEPGQPLETRAAANALRKEILRESREMYGPVRGRPVVKVCKILGSAAVTVPSSEPS